MPAPKLNQQVVGNVGLYNVCYEFSRRVTVGWQLTLRAALRQPGLTNGSTGQCA